jgi:hypothetical protein
MIQLYLCTGGIKMKNYYDILEIHPKSGHEVIELAYKSLYKHFNPGNFVSNEEILQAKVMRNQLNEAYKILSNPAKKAKYDKYFNKRCGRTEIRKNKKEALLVFFAVALIIIITAKYAGDWVFKKTGEFGIVLIANPTLKIFVIIFALIISIYFFINEIKRRV